MKSILLSLLVFAGVNAFAQSNEDVIQSVISTTCGQFKTYISINQRACKDTAKAWMKKYPYKPQTGDDYHEMTLYKVDLAQAICSGMKYSSKKKESKTECLQGALLVNGTADDNQLCASEKGGDFNNCVTGLLNTIRGTAFDFLREVPMQKPLNGPNGSSTQ